MTQEEEARSILALAAGDSLRVLNILEGQLNVLHTRAQVLLSLAGIVITVTGFSGRIIAATSRPAQLFIIVGLLTVLSAAVWLYTKVSRISWITREFIGHEKDLVGAVVQIIQKRDRKTAAYAIGGRILCLGLVLYCIAVAIMLLNPEPLAIAPR